MAPLRVGLTGGIGSGKSTICQQFDALGVPVIDADHIAHRVVATGQPALQELAHHFGKKIINPDGSLNRAALRKIIFNQPHQKRYVETLLHPLILQQIQQQLEAIAYPYVIIEIPLLIEAGWQPYVDKILVVDLPKSLQIERLMKMDDIKEKELLQIIDSQLSRSERINQADQVIDNSVNRQEISRQIGKIHQHYLQLADKQHA